MDPAPGLVVVGHVTKDADEGGYLLGGAAYAALTAARLGYRVGLVTSCGPDLEPGIIHDNIEVSCRPAPTSTVFRNAYVGGSREQMVLSVALPLEVSQIRPSWRGAPVLLAPMAGEIGPEFLDGVSGWPIGACPQGWMRRWGPDGRVEAAPWDWAGAGLRQIQFLVLSSDDLAGDETLASDWATKVNCMALTCGAEGAWVYCQGRREHIPAFAPSRVVDPTGAGDAFASAFLLKWHETGDPLQSGLFASLVGSFVVEEKGLAGIPSRERVEEAWRRLAPTVN